MAKHKTHCKKGWELLPRILKKSWRCWTGSMGHSLVNMSCHSYRHSSISPVWSSPCAQSSPPVQLPRSHKSLPPSRVSPSFLRLRLKSFLFPLRHHHRHPPPGSWQPGYETWVRVCDLRAGVICRSLGPIQPTVWAEDQHTHWRWTAALPFLDALCRKWRKKMCITETNKVYMCIHECMHAWIMLPLM